MMIKGRGGGGIVNYSDNLDSITSVGITDFPFVLCNLEYIRQYRPVFCFNVSIICNVIKCNVIVEIDMLHLNIRMLETHIIISA